MTLTLKTLSIACAIGLGTLLVACSSNTDKPAAQQQPAAQAQPEEQTMTVSLPSMKCNTCARHITSAVTKVAGVTECSVNVDDKKATIKYAPAKVDQAKIEMAIAQSGYDANNVKRNEDAYSQLPECCK